MCPLPGRAADEPRTQILGAPRTRDRGSHAGWPLSTPIVQTAAFGFASGAEASQAAADGQPLYSRDGLPNVTEFEQAVAELEGAEAAVAMPSGMAAIALTLMALADPAIAWSPPKMPIRRRGNYSAGCSAGSAPSRSSSTSPSRPSSSGQWHARRDWYWSRRSRIRVCGPLICRGSREQRSGLAPSSASTTPSPRRHSARRSAHGADLVLHSAGKLLAGHHDVTAGVVAGRRTLIEAIRAERQLFGAVLAPMEAWLATRGLRTLKLRMAWISRSAEAIVPRLAAHPAVTRVSYPGFGPRGDLLPKGAGGLLAVCFTGGKVAAEQFIRSLRTIPYAATVGGPTTTVSYPPVEHRPAAVDAYACGTVRISLGLEEPEEVWRDLRQALDAVAVPVLV